MQPRASRIGLIALMALGSLALWTAIPVGWLWATRNMEATGLRFVISIAGCVLSMSGAGILLYRVEAAYYEMTGGAPTRPAPEGQRSRMSVLETLLVWSALVAVGSLILWWALFADSSNPSGPLQPL